jgi:DNA-binding IclR family transcriptional regulator
MAFVASSAYSPAMGNDPLGSRAADSSGGVQSVDRAITILEILSERREAGVSEIAQEISVHKSTAFRLLGALESRGLVEQAEDRGKYRLSFGIIRLAGGVASRLDLTQQSRPVCRRLAEEIGETVNIAVLRSHYAVNLDQVRGPAAVTTHNWVGELTPLHATSSGKVLLAHMPPTLREGFLARTLPRFTERTITGTSALRGELETVVEQGYGVNLEEMELGLTAVAAPIRAHDGKVIAAISASGPVYRMNSDRLPEVAKRTVAAGAELSRRMGYGF